MNYIDSKTLTGHSASVLSVAVINENTIISGSYDQSLKIWCPPPTLVKGVDQSSTTRCGGGGGGGGVGSLFAE